MNCRTVFDLAKDQAEAERLEKLVSEQGFWNRIYRGKLPFFETE
jgi:uncharacterized membrane protein